MKPIAGEPTVIIYLFDMSIRNDIISAANRYGVPPELALAVAMQESNLRHYDASGNVIRGAAGEYGIFQLMPPTAAGLNVDPRDPSQNIDGGVRYLAEQYSRFGDWRKALTAYNAGPGTVLNPSARPTAFAQGSAYASQVLARTPSTLQITEQPGGVRVPSPPVIPFQAASGGGDGEPALFTVDVLGKDSHTALFVILGLMTALVVSESL